MYIQKQVFYVCFILVIFTLIQFIGVIEAEKESRGDQRETRSKQEREIRLKQDVKQEVGQNMRTIQEIGQDMRSRQETNRRTSVFIDNFIPPKPKRTEAEKMIDTAQEAVIDSIDNSIDRKKKNRNRTRGVRWW